jgi:glyoxylase-like metal-dependent hydrolase (beta-lactamase superfamily II)
MVIPTAQIMTPEINGHTNLTAPSFSFLIEHPSGRKLVFDLGLRKDYENLPPVIQKFLEDSRWAIEVRKNVSEILEEGGIETSDIESVIWSHHHFDHVGDMSTFPSTTGIIVGPGFKNNYMPAWPMNKNSTLKETDWEGRGVREISFVAEGNGLKVGPFDALDFFGDGSYYILDSPGHTFGHITALARVTSNGGDPMQDTFVFMGGDTCHFAGEFRPTAFQPLPTEIKPNPLPQLHAGSCPGALFQAVHPTNSATEPFYQMPKTSTVNLDAAHESIRKLELFDAAENVLVIIAHDLSILGQIDFFPESINAWNEKGYGEKVRWQFLEGFDKVVGFDQTSTAGSKHSS